MEICADHDAGNIMFSGIFMALCKKIGGLVPAEALRSEEAYHTGTDTLYSYHSCESLYYDGQGDAGADEYNERSGIL